MYLNPAKIAYIQHDYIHPLQIRVKHFIVHFCSEFIPTRGGKSLTRLLYAARGEPETVYRSNLIKTVCTTS